MRKGPVPVGVVRVRVGGRARGRRGSSWGAYVRGSARVAPPRGGAGWSWRRRGARCWRPCGARAPPTCRACCTGCATPVSAAQRGRDRTAQRAWLGPVGRSGPGRRAAARAGGGGSGPWTRGSVPGPGYRPLPGARGSPGTGGYRPDGSAGAECGRCCPLCSAPIGGGRARPSGAPVLCHATPRVPCRAVPRCCGRGGGVAARARPAAERDGLPLKARGAPGVRSQPAPAAPRRLWVLGLSCPALHVYTAAFQEFGNSGLSSFTNTALRA